MAGKIVMALGALAGISYVNRGRIARTEAYKRAGFAVHVMRGRPLIYGVKLVPPPAMRLADGNENVLIADTSMDMSNGLVFG